MRSANACVISRLCPGKLLFIIDRAALPLEDVTRPRADVQEQQPWALRPPWHKVRALLGVSPSLALAVREQQDALGRPLSDLGAPRCGKWPGPAQSIPAAPLAPARKWGVRLPPLCSPVADTESSTRGRAPALAQAGAARGPGTREGKSVVRAGGCYEHWGLCHAPAPHNPLGPQRGVWGKEIQVTAKNLL